MLPSVEGIVRKDMSRAVDSVIMQSGRIFLTLTNQCPWGALGGIVFR